MTKKSAAKPDTKLFIGGGIAALVLIAATAFFMSRPAQWITFTPPSGAYTVQLPKQPEPQPQNTDMSATFTAIAKDGVVYNVTSTTYPTELPETSVESTITGLRAAANSIPGTTMGEISNVSSGPYKGVRYSMMNQEMKTTTEIMTLVGKKQQFTLTAVATAGKQVNPVFFTSFTAR